MKFCVTVALIAALAGPAVAGTVDLTASADTFLFSSSYANTAYGSHTLMGVYWGSARQKSVVKFDLGSLAGGKTIKSAVLTLYVDGHGNPWNNANHAYNDLYRMTESWVESEATWNQRSSGVSWATGGGSYVGTTGVHESSPYATTNESVVNFGDPLTWDVTDLVKGWCDGTWANHGLIVMTRSPSPINQLHFRTLEYTGDAYSPTLTVTIVPLPGAAVAGLALMAGLAIVRVAQRSKRTTRT